LSADTHPLVAFIGATPAAIPPARAAFAEHFPEATLWNVLDDRLITEAVAAGGLTRALSERMSTLVRYAVDGGADAVLLTCSMYGPVAHEFTGPVPVDASDDAAFHAAASSGYGRILLLSTLPEALHDAEERFAAFAAGMPGAPTVIPVLAERAFAAASAGDTGAVLDALAEAASGAGLADAVLLAQYSLAPAAGELADRLGLPVIAGPTRAAQRMREALLGQQS
jgi:hypothetical protein